MWGKCEDVKMWGKYHLGSINYSIPSVCLLPPACVRAWRDSTHSACGSLTATRGTPTLLPAHFIVKSFRCPYLAVEWICTPSSRQSIIPISLPFDTRQKLNGEKSCLQYCRQDWQPIHFVLLCLPLDWARSAESKALEPCWVIPHGKARADAPAGALSAHAREAVKSSPRCPEFAVKGTAVGLHEDRWRHFSRLHTRN